MRLFFLNPPFKYRISRASRWPEETKSGTLYYPFWLAYATGVAENLGFEVFLYDAIAEKSDFKKTLKKIMEYEPDMLVMETVTPTIESDAKFANYVKKNYKDIPVVAVGPHVTALPRETLENFKEFDFVAYGEFDYTIPDLAQNLGNPKKVKGIGFRENGKITLTPPRPPIKNLDELPFVSKVYKKFLNPYNYFYAFSLHPMIQIFSARGCPFKCVFCQLPQTLEGRIFRYRSSQNLIEEFKYIKEEMPFIKEIFIEDDTFTVNRKRVEEFCDLLIENEIKIPWSVNVRADVPSTLLKKMKKAGARLLVVGYESGDQRVLNLIKKGITLKQSLEFTRNAKKFGFQIFGCFMLGLPGETKKEIYKTYKFAEKLNPDMVFFQHAMPFPGTEFYKWLEKNHLLKAKKWSEWLDNIGRLKVIHSLPTLNQKEIEKLREKLMSKYYFRIYYFIRTILKMLNPKETKHIVKASLSFLLYKIKRVLKK